MTRWIAQQLSTKFLLLSIALGLVTAAIGAVLETALLESLEDGGVAGESVLGLLVVVAVHGIGEVLVVSIGFFVVVRYFLISRVQRLEREVQGRLADPDAVWSVDAKDALGDEIDRLRFAWGRVYARLKGEELHLKQMVEEVQSAESRLVEAQSLARMGSWEYTPTEKRPTWTRQVYRIFGHDPTKPPPRLEEHLQQYHHEDRQRLVDLLGRSQETGGSFHGRFRISPTPGVVRWVENHGYCRLDGSGRVTRIVGTCQDVTEQVEREEALTRLTRELNHRVKNNLGSVLALIGETRGSAQSVDDFAERLTGRVRAMAMVHETATATDDSAVDLRRLIERVLAPHVGDDRRHVRTEGSRCSITTTAARPLTLTLHELANNAQKHGALSADGGTMEVEWRRSTEHGVMIWWRERLDRPREIEVCPGVGMGLARGFVEHEIAGAFNVSVEPGGIAIQIGLPPQVVRWPVSERAVATRSA
ncbi:MAG: HWE histidine kinase domain-containing protein [Planctomycetota bacterium]